MGKRLVDRLAAELARVPSPSAPGHDWQSPPPDAPSAVHARCGRDGCGWVWVTGHAEPEFGCKGSDPPCKSS